MSPRRVFHRSLALCLLTALAATAAHAVDHQRGYLVNSLSLPINASQARSYAIDLNGDGYVDNNLGSVLVALGSLGVDFAGSTSAAVASGSIVHLLSLHSTDAFFGDDPAAKTDWYVGLPAPAPPLFDGTDDLPDDNNYLPGVFLAALSNGAFTSVDPATTTDPVYLRLNLAFGSYVVSLPLQGARLAFSTNNAGHMQGQINGSIRQDDVMNIIPPALANMFNSIIQNDPTSTTAQQLLALFDTGCNGGGANDGFIAVCEVTGNSLLQGLLAPDVQIRDANGNYAPNPANTTPDANSFGIRFTAIVSPDRVFANGFEPN